MITLCLDASTYVGDVAVLRDGTVLAEESIAMKGADHERLMPAVASVLDKSGVAVRDVDRVVCGAGPGSFTSLRIAGAIAKGIASGGGKPLYAVPSMALMIAGASLPAGRYLVAVDALRGEFYVGLYSVEPDTARTIIEHERARLVHGDDVDRIAEEYEARVVTPTLRPHAIEALPLARGLARLESSGTGLAQVDVNSWEPSYGRLAEAQVKWEKAHGRPLSAG
ncbi:MAG: tRNA (adenosine(37)-N6)-threonylcarbamoyltransferase complex dimerization subunit type 1 TsaB [Gemmatimonadaceae bacterium]